MRATKRTRARKKIKARKSKKETQSKRVKSRGAKNSIKDTLATFRIEPPNPKPSLLGYSLSWGRIRAPEAN